MCHKLRKSVTFRWILSPLNHSNWSVGLWFPKQMVRIYSHHNWIFHVARAPPKRRLPNFQDHAISSWLVPLAGHLLDVNDLLLYVLQCYVELYNMKDSKVTWVENTYSHTPQHFQVYTACENTSYRIIKGAACIIE